MNSTHFVYTCIGKSQASIKSIVNYLEAKGAMKNTTIIVGDPGELPTVQAMSVYTASQIGIHSRESGQDCIIIIDEMNTHVNLNLTLQNKGITSIATSNYECSKIFETGGDMKQGGSVTYIAILEGTMELYEGNIYQQFAMFLIDLADRVFTLSRDNNVNNKNNNNNNMWVPGIVWNEEQIDGKSISNKNEQVGQLILELQNKFKEVSPIIHIYV